MAITPLSRYWAAQLRSSLLHLIRSYLLQRPRHLLAPISRFVQIRHVLAQRTPSTHPYYCTVLLREWLEESCCLNFATDGATKPFGAAVEQAPRSSMNAALHYTTREPEKQALRLLLM